MNQEEPSNDERDDFDSPWKDILKEFFKEFIEYFFADVYSDINWSKGYRFLDKELQQVVQDAELGRRYADKLVEVTRKNGDMGLVVVHIEVQGEPEITFGERMYTYNYRLYDRYRLPVVSLAVLSDVSEKWQRNHFGYDLWGCKIRFEFPVVKLRAYTSRWTELETSHNPFAIVVMAHLKTQETHQNDQARQQWKLYLIRRLYRHGFSKDDIIKLFHFIDWIMKLPEGLDNAIWLEVMKFEEERRMPYISSIERISLEKGMERGMEKGMAKGMEKGMQRALYDILLRLLVHRFGPIDGEFQSKLQLLRNDQLDLLVNEALTIESLEKFSQQVAYLPIIVETDINETDEA